ncbi:MAG: hypothetical protein EA423_03900 [Phycisphaerales bacterium]|nr:MAG: hypothetical protein EA423_03900 [Phycisphaerales bacterium]
MAIGTLTDLGDRLPRGFGAATVDHSQAGGPVRVCVLVSERPDPASGRLVVLRETPEARVCLGAMLDASDAVVHWLEIWVQHFDGLDSTPPAYRDALTNRAMDERWSKLASALDKMPRRTLIRTGHEDASPRPTWIDPEAMAPVHPVVQGVGVPLELCTDDALLREVGLPEYSTTLARYLWSPEMGLESPFVPVTRATPETGPSVSLEAATGETRELVPLNPCGGRMLVRLHAPMALEEYDRLIEGGAWEGPRHGKSPLPLDPPEPEAFADPDEAERGLLLGRQGKCGRTVEALHLKLRTLAQAVDEVARLTASTGRPLLNLTDASFRVFGAGAGVGLPSLWASRVSLVEAGTAVELALGEGGASCFLVPEEELQGIFRPRVRTAVRGRGSVRIREVHADGGKGLVVEGTLSTDERVGAASSDVVWLVLPVGDRRIDLYASVSADRAMAGGELRLKSFGRALSDEDRAALEGARGVLIEQVSFEVIPLLRSPCDMHALAVLGAKLLLAGPDRPLSVVLDELMSLAGRLAEGGGHETPIEDRIAAVFDEDPRWIEALGPLRLTSEGVEPGEAFGLVPSGVWFSALGTLVKMLPGAGPDSVSRDPGDARPGGLHLIYEPIIERLGLLLVRTRSLIVIDWNYNREINGVLRRFMSGLAPSGADA